GASALWWIMECDRITTPDGCGYDARCPAQASAQRSPNEPDLADEVRAIAPRYLMTVVSGASGSEIEQLRQLAAGTADLESYRPFAVWMDEPSVVARMEDAIAQLTLRRPTAAQLCEGVEEWASAFDQVAREHTIPPVNRIGALAWLACVALRPE